MVNSMKTPCNTPTGIQSLSRTNEVESPPTSLTMNSKREGDDAAKEQGGNAPEDSERASKCAADDLEGQREVVEKNLVSVRKELLKKMLEQRAVSEANVVARTIASDSLVDYDSQKAASTKVLKNLHDKPTTTVQQIKCECTCREVCDDIKTMLKDATELLSKIQAHQNELGENLKKFMDEANAKSKVTSDKNTTTDETAKEGISTVAYERAPSQQEKQEV
ncbi:unnamed protein product [Anisakis simplex]|uniref:Uncharacterized protein n=1 Tax=Anisakis simplex TaxID=6269 RepID=A0A0M3JET9_ANISI|nr:unnamed protein product [Anisakis simplex]